jgi:hypothetical protein
VASLRPEIAIDRTGNTLSVAGQVSLRSYKRVLAAIYDATSRAGYSDIVVDFSRCSRAFYAPMLAVCAQLRELRESGVYSELILPANGSVARLFTNANWAHIIDPRRYDPSRFRGRSRIAATNFHSPTEQKAVVDQILEAMLNSTEGLDRSQFQAFEWCVNEITDNVLTHSQSRAGGLVQVSTFDTGDFTIEFDVCDAGIGIPNSLRQGRIEVGSDANALDSAIREGITRDPNIGQGNGLYGTYQVCAISKGAFQIHSGYANLSHSNAQGLHVYTEQIPLTGTLVVSRVCFGEKGLLEHALKFGGKPHVPVDFIDTRYAADVPGALMFRLVDEARSWGSRIAGSPVRVKLKNLIDMSRAQRIDIDFSGVPLISSSFADEVFGKLFVELGPTAFMSKLRLSNAPAVVQSLIDKAILQRSRAPT